MNLIPTELNQNLVEAVTNRISAEHSRIRGQSAFWRFVALGTLNCGLGVAIGFGLYGYSHIKKNQTDLPELSAVLAKELANTSLRGTASGSVVVKSQDVRLAAAQIISLDPNTRVRLDPEAKVLADGEMRVHAPTITTPQANSPKNVASSMVTNFTIFKNVPLEKGAVMTGWNFLTSAQRAPTDQYCYYTENAQTPGLNIVVELGRDGKIEPPSNLPRGFDLNASFEKCVWFRDS